MEKDLKIKGICAGIGLGVWVLGCIAGMRAEAWDSPLYFSILFPAMVMAAGVMGFRYPHLGWRGGGWMVLGHGVAVIVVGLLAGRGLGLLPLTVIVFLIISAPLCGAAWLGGFVAEKVKKTKDD